MQSGQSDVNRVEVIAEQMSADGSAMQSGNNTEQKTKRGGHHLRNSEKAMQRIQESMSLLMKCTDCCDADVSSSDEYVPDRHTRTTCGIYGCTEDIFWDALTARIFFAIIIFKQPAMCIIIPRSCLCCQKIP